MTVHAISWRFDKEGKWQRGRDLYGRLIILENRNMILAERQRYLQTANLLGVASRLLLT